MGDTTFVGLGRWGTAYHRSASIVTVLVVALVCAAVTPGSPVPGPLEGLLVVPLFVAAWQGARASRQGVTFGPNDVVVSGLVFERVIALRDVSDVVFPGPIGPLRVGASDGGLAGSQLWAGPLEALLDRRSRSEVIAHVTANLDTLGVSTSSAIGRYSRWGMGVNWGTPMVARRFMAVTAVDGAWLVTALLLWLFATLL